jgi:hypothetical protein
LTAGKLVKPSRDPAGFPQLEILPAHPRPIGAAMKAPRAAGLPTPWDGRLVSILATPVAQGLFYRSNVGNVSGAELADAGAFQCAQHLHAEQNKIGSSAPLPRPVS